VGEGCCVFVCVCVYVCVRAHEFVCVCVCARKGKDRLAKQMVDQT